ncbi:MAG: type VI secretion system ATPase TssH [Byssovorax sp.]
MMPVELRPLLGRLNRPTAHALEAAASACIARGHHEVSPEHLLAELLRDGGADLGKILAHFDADPARLARSVEASIDDFRHGSTGKPVLSPLLVEWVADGWMLASIEQGLGAVRGGSLIAALVTRPARYLGGDHPELAKIRAEELRLGFRGIVAGSTEDEAPAGGGPEKVARPRAAAEGGALARFAQDLTAQAREGALDPVFGRDREIRQVIDILSRRRKNNPIIVGEAGVGKTAIVEGLALRIACGDVPDDLREVAIFGLDLGLLQAGAGVKGEFETRLKAVIDEVKAAPRRTILFIDEAHMLIGAGAAPGSGDAANLLKPALARGELRTIAATTWAEYKQHFEEDAALARRFQPVKIDEPSIDDAALMLRGLKARYEATHGVAVRDDAIDAAVRLSARYITGRLLPDKAVDLLDTSAARVKISQTAKPGPIEDLERRRAALTRQNEALLRDQQSGAAIDREQHAAVLRDLARAEADLESLGARWREQRDALAHVLDLRARTPIDEAALGPALAALAAAQGKEPLVRLEVDPEVVAQVVEDWTGVPAGKMVRDDAAQVLGLEARLRARIRGQDHALATVGEALRSKKLGLVDPGKPQVFLLVGPSGVGKTELGLTVADQLYGGERFVITINMSEYQDREMGVSGLIGAKPGYVGYGKGGALTEAVRQRPYAVVLLDEIEKACQEVRNLFYQVFDKGELTDGTGRKVDFKNTIVFLTTNLTAPFIQKRCSELPLPSPTELLDEIRPALSRALQPAWIARTTIVPFYPLAEAALAEIAALKLGELAARLREAQKIELVTPPEVIARIARRCTEVETGARNIDFIVQRTLMPKITAEILARMASGTPASRLTIGLDEDWALVVTASG